ncbi:MAG: hypothetical protein S4CHLAM20_04680 [Chlamydiia bacterium]|nr:hypothetical protein [Chlamydiia bacterium]
MLKGFRFIFIMSLLCIIIGSVRLITNNPFNKQHNHEINVYAWSAYFDHEMLESFYKETGIKVNIHFYNSNDELLTQLSINKGENVDLLFPSDYTSRVLIKNNAVKKIDKSKLNFTKYIYPFLLDKEYDPGNEYSLPYTWEVYGLAFDGREIKHSLSLKDLFSEKHLKVMTPDPFEMTSIASQYLYGNKESLNDNEVDELIKMLKSQKPTTEAYADFRAKDIITSKNADLTLLKTSYLDELMTETHDVNFSLPDDVIFLCIENAMIGKKSKNTDDIYTFLNYIYKPKNLALTIDIFPAYPSCSDALEYTKRHHPIYLKTIDEVENRELDLRFFSYITKKETIRQIIVETKA